MTRFPVGVSVEVVPNGESSDFAGLGEVTGILFDRGKAWHQVRCEDGTLRSLPSERLRHVTSQEERQ